uniref:L-Fucosyltransferase n=1 Tax=Timema cristinae TaxID=61476 RepID=A0A7R9DLT2_TIMCR|nr:unnamed protein product [Timema cristinae]
MNTLLLPDFVLNIANRNFSSSIQTQICLGESHKCKCKYRMNTKCVTLVVLTLVCLITLVVLVGRERFQEQNISLVKRDKKPCPKGVITVLDHGRLCNQIFEYVSVWVLARRHGLLPFVPNTIHDKLRGLFAHLSIPPLSQLIDSSGDCPKLNKNSLNRASSQDLFDVDDRAIRTNESEDPFVLREYIVLIRFIVPILDEVKEEFKYHPEIVTVAQTRLRWSRSRLEADHGSREVTSWRKMSVERSHSSTNPVGMLQTLFVGVHVRRDDYFRAFQAFGVTSYADAGYYKHAVSWMLRKLTSEATSAHNIAFVLASDDPAWCKEVLVPELKDEIRAFGNHTNLGKKQVCSLYLLVQGTGCLVVLAVTRISRPLYLSSAPAQAAPPTFSTAWTTPQSMFSKPSVTKFPTVLSAHENSSFYWLAWRPLSLTFYRTNGKLPFLPKDKARQQWRVFSMVVPRSEAKQFCLNSFSFHRHPLPPTMTHVAGTPFYLPPRLTLLGLHSTSHRDSCSWDSILPPTVTHVAGTPFYLPPRLTLAGTPFYLPP